MGTLSKCWLRKRSFWWSILQDFFFQLRTFFIFSEFSNFFPTRILYQNVNLYRKGVKFSFFFFEPLLFGDTQQVLAEKTKIFEGPFLEVFYHFVFSRLHIFFIFFFPISSEFLIFSLYIIVYIKIINFFKVKLLKKKNIFFFFDTILLEDTEQVLTKKTKTFESPFWEIFHYSYPLTITYIFQFVPYFFGMFKICPHWQFISKY